MQLPKFLDSDIFQLTYAHETESNCTPHYENGHRYTDKYEQRIVDCIMFRISGSYPFETDYYHIYLVGDLNKAIGIGEDKTDARHDASYNLMNQSRKNPVKG